MLAKSKSIEWLLKKLHSVAFHSLMYYHAEKFYWTFIKTFDA